MTPPPRLRTAKRFSSSRFSDVILADRIRLTCSWSDQRSSTVIASRSIFFIDILRPYITFRAYDSLMSYYSVDYSASGQLRLSATKDCFGRYEETRKYLPMSVIWFIVH